MLQFIEQLAQEMGAPVALILVAIIWSITWKAIALWKSARLNQPVWFVAFFLIHTLGILEILYIFLFSKIQLPSVKPHKARGKRK